jgi:hypothetical protein
MIARICFCLFFLSAAFLIFVWLKSTGCQHKRGTCHPWKWTIFKSLCVQVIFVYLWRTQADRRVIHTNYLLSIRNGPTMESAAQTKTQGATLSPSVHHPIANLSVMSAVPAPVSLRELCPSPGSWPGLQWLCGLLHVFPLFFSFKSHSHSSPMFPLRYKVIIALSHLSILWSSGLFFSFF